MADPSLQPITTPLVLGQSYPISSLFKYVPGTGPNGKSVIGVRLGLFPTPNETIVGSPPDSSGLDDFLVAGNISGVTTVGDPSWSTGTITFTGLSGPLYLSGYLQFIIGKSTEFPSGWAFADPVSYSFSFATALFTTGADGVNFNSLTSDQISAVNGGADLYNSLAGNDDVTLPNIAHYQLTSTVAWGPSQTFTAGDGNDLITGGDGSYNIALGAGSDTVTINGNGSSKITAGTGSDTITITGNGNNIVRAGTGDDTITINGNGDNTIDIGKGPDSVDVSGTSHTTLQDGSSTSGVTITDFKGDATDEDPTAVPTSATQSTPAATVAATATLASTVQTNSSPNGVLVIDHPSSGNVVINNGGVLVLEAKFTGPIGFKTTASGKFAWLQTIPSGTPLGTAAAPQTVTGFSNNTGIDFALQSGLVLFGPGNASVTSGPIKIYAGNGAKTPMASLSLSGIDLTTLEPLDDGNGGTEIVVDRSNVGSSDPMGTKIKWTFIHVHESPGGVENLAPYVPGLGTSQSGVTIGYGVDLGTNNIQLPSFAQAFSKHGIVYTKDPNLRFLASTIGDQQDDAVDDLTNIGPAPGSKTVTSKAVSITKSQANILSSAAENLTLQALLKTWQNSGSLVAFNKLPEQAQTVLYDVAYQYGATKLPSKTPTFWKLMVNAANTITTAKPNGDPIAWSKVYQELTHFGDAYASRRLDEAALILQLATGAVVSVASAQPGTASPSGTQFNVSAANSTTQYVLESAENPTTTVASAATASVTAAAQVKAQAAASPPGPGTFTLIGSAGSPALSSIELPGEGAASYLVSYYDGTGWSSPQAGQPLQIIKLPKGVSGLQVTLLNGGGIPEANPGNFSFYVTYASAGTFKGTLTSPPSISLDQGMSFSDTGSMTLTGGVATDAKISSIEIFDGSTDLGAATINADGTWSFTTTLAAGVHNAITALATDLLGYTATATAPFALTTGITAQPYSAQEQIFNGDGNVFEYVYFNSDGSTYLDSANPVTVAQFQAFQSTLDTINGGFAVEDAAANIEAGLSNLAADSNLASITSSDVPVAVSTTAFAADQTTLDKILGGFVISDLVTNVAADFDALNGDANITSITLTDGGSTTLALTVEQALNDTKGLGKLVEPYLLAVTDIAAQIETLTAAEIAKLGASHFGSVSASDASISLTAAQAIAFESAHIALAAPSGDSVSVSDTAAHIALLTLAQVRGLKAIGVSSISSTDLGVRFGVAKALALETEGVTVSAASGGVMLFDTAADLQTLTGAEIQGLPGFGVIGVKAADLPVTLTVAQALAFETAGLKITPPPGYLVRILDTASTVSALTPAQIAGLTAVGVSRIRTTDAGAKLTVAQAQALESAGVALYDPLGTVTTISDTAANIETLTTFQIAGLTKLSATRVSASDASLTLDMAEALAFGMAGIKLAAPSGDSVSVADLAASIEALTPAQILGLGASHVSAIAASDASVFLSAAQGAAFESVHIALSAPSGDSMSVSDTAAHLQALTTAQLAGLPKIDVTNLNDSSGNVLFSAAQTSVLLANNMGLSASRTYRVAETFTDGAIISFGDDGSGGGRLNLGVGNGLTVNIGASLLSVTAGSQTANLTPHATETIVAAAGLTHETFVFGSGFGTDTMNGFVSAGASHDLLQFSATAFGETSATTQTEDFSALLAHTTQNGAGNAVIADGFGDTLTIAGVSLATLTTHPADFKFV